MPGVVRCGMLLETESDRNDCLTKIAVPITPISPACSLAAARVSPTPAAAGDEAHIWQTRPARTRPSDFDPRHFRWA